MKVGSVYLTLKSEKQYPWPVEVTQEQWDWLKENVEQDRVLDLPTEADGVKHFIKELPPSITYRMPLERPTEPAGAFTGGESYPPTSPR